jgi:DNA-binding transcriptional LysR family regulator
MDIAELKAFVVVAETGSFSEAADRLYITQPAVSKRIAALETELGSALFDRIGRSIQLTEAGVSLLPQSQEILARIGDLKQTVSNLTGHIAGSLNMATSHHIGLHRLPPALRQFTRQYPDVELSLEFLASEVACEAVLTGRLEIAIVTLPEVADPQLSMHEVWTDPLYLVAGLDHPLARQKTVSPEQLVAYPAILPGPNTVTRAEVVQALGAHANNLNVRMTSNYLEVLKTLAGIGLGWSALPKTMIDDSLSMVHVKKIEIKRRLGIVSHRQRTLSNAAQRMIDTIQDCA